MPNTPTDDLTSQLRDALVASVDDVTVPGDLTARVRAGRRRAHRRTMAMKVALPVAVLAASATALTVVDRPAGPSGSTTQAEAPSSTDGQVTGSKDVTFRLVGYQAPTGAATAREKNCVKAAEAGFTAPLTDGTLSLAAVSDGCLGVLLKSDDRLRVTVERSGSSMNLELWADGRRDAGVVTFTVTNLDADRPLAVRSTADDLLLSRGILSTDPR